MRQIAAEMNVAETAFLTPTTRQGANLRLRWFTPGGKEVTFCGHATLATVHALVEAGRLSGDRVVFDTLAGPLAAAVTPTPQGNVIWLEPALPTCAPYPEALIPVLEALGMGAEGLASWTRPAVTPERDLLLPVTGLEVLRHLSPDMSRLARLGSDRDPVTRSVHASLAVWLWQAGLLTADGDIATFRAEQGDLLGRPGRLRVELHLVGHQPGRVRVGGRAVTVLSGTIRVE